MRTPTRKTAAAQKKTLVETTWSPVPVSSVTVPHQGIHKLLQDSSWDVRSMRGVI